MSNQSQGRRKSNFPGSTTVVAADTFDFVSGGVNYKIPFSDLQTALGLPYTTYSMSVNNGDIAVAIAVAGTAVQVEGTWLDQLSNLFSVDGAGTVTFSGTVGVVLPINLSLICDPDVGTAIAYTVSIYINGVIAAQSAVSSVADAGDKNQINVQWLHNFSTADYVEVFLANDTDTADFTVTNAQLRIG